MALKSGARPPAPIELSARSGELKHATALFADIVGSTELVANMDPEEARECLEPALAAMRAGVEHFGGTVVRTMGDGLLALFGAPVALEGHAQLACQAALAIQRAFPVGADGLKIRIGLHCGEVMCEPARLAGTTEVIAYGLAIHVASRLQELAAPGGICMSADLYRLVSSSCIADSAGMHRLRGVPGAVEAFMLASWDAAAGAQFSVQRLATFRGRSHELAVLQRAVTAGPGGGSRVIGVRGAPGTGKSRLCHEFGRWCRSQLIPVHEVGGQIYGHATPLQPIIRLLRLLLGIGADDPPDAARAHIEGRLLDGSPEGARHAGILNELMGAGGPFLNIVNPQAKLAILRQAVGAVIKAAGTTPQVIIIDDLHWLDGASEEVVLPIVQAVNETRLTLVLNYRQSYEVPWAKSASFAEIALSDLADGAIEELVDELVGTGTGTRYIRRQIAVQSGGNPFFAEELIRSLSENGSLVGDVGHYRAGAGAGAPATALPPTIQAVVGARIDRLTPAARSLLQIAAVIGKDFALPILARIAALDEQRIAEDLEELQAAELIRERTVDGMATCSFRHPLVQEVAYGAQLRSRRALLHAAVAEAMIERFAASPDEQAGLIAHHFEAAGETRRAADYAARAALWVGAMHTSQAIQYWRRARRLLLASPPEPDRDELVLAASAQIAWLGWREGLTMDEVKPFIDEALALAARLDVGRVPLLMFVEARITGANGGSADDYASRVQRAIAMVDTARSPGRAATLFASLSQAYGWAGRFRQALDANDRALACAAAGGAMDDAFLGYGVADWALSLRGRILVNLGRLAEAVDCFEAMLAKANALIDPTVQFISHLGYVDIAYQTGDAALAVAHAERVGALSRGHGSPYLRVFAAYCRGVALCLQREHDTAITEFQDSLDLVTRTRAAVDFEADIRAAMAEAFLLRGDWAGAADAAAAALATARERHTRLAECHARIVYGFALLRADKAGEAEPHLRRACRLRMVTGARALDRLFAQQPRRHRGGGMLQGLRTSSVYSSRP